MDYEKLLRVAIDEAKAGLAEGGIPIGACLADREGRVLGRGHNRRVQQQDPSVHGETDAFRNAGRQRGYRDKVMVTTLAPTTTASRGHPVTTAMAWPAVMVSQETRLSLPSRCSTTTRIVSDIMSP